MLNTFSRRLIISHLIPVLLVVPLMGFAFEFLLGTHALSTSTGGEIAGTICAHFQTLATPFAGVILLGLAFGSLVAWVLARAADRPLQKVIQDVISLAGDHSKYPMKESGPQEIQNLLHAVNMLSQSSSETETGKQSRNSQPVELSQWLPQALEIWRESAEAKNLNWDAILPGSLLELVMSPDRLKPTVDCLLHNVIHSAAPGSRISVHFKIANDAVCITIGHSMTGYQVGHFSDMPQNTSGNAHLIFENVSDLGNAFTLQLPLRGT